MYTAIATHLLLLQPTHEHWIENRPTKKELYESGRVLCWTQHKLQSKLRVMLPFFLAFAHLMTKLQNSHSCVPSQRWFILASWMNNPSFSHACNNCLTWVIFFCTWSRICTAAVQTWILFHTTKSCFSVQAEDTTQNRVGVETNGCSIIDFCACIHTFLLLIARFIEQKPFFLSFTSAKNVPHRRSLLDTAWLLGDFALLPRTLSSCHRPRLHLLS